MYALFRALTLNMLITLCFLHISNINWSQLFMFFSPDNEEGIWQIFKSVIMDSIKTYKPLRHAVNNCGPRQYLTYIQRAIKQKRALCHRRRFMRKHAI